MRQELAQSVISQQETVVLEAMEERKGRKKEEAMSGEEVEDEKG
jgi:hypothetical protein